jgi:hypothetical protein
MRRYLIPIYGFVLGMEEHRNAREAHSRACDQHKHACAEYKRNPTYQNREATWSAYEDTWKAFDKTWPAMDHAILGLWATAAELAMLSVIVLWGLWALGVV